jgi:hypothetical protein
VHVTGLPLTLGSLDYYQVYFSVLAALGPRDPTYCPRALDIVRQVRATGYEAQRPDITTNITAAQLQCSDAAPVAAGATATLQTGTPRVIPTSTPYVAPTATAVETSPTSAP